MSDLTHLISDLVAMEKQIFTSDRLNAEQFRGHLRRGEVFFTPVCMLVMDFSHPHYSRIESIGVLSLHQGKGVGKVLLDLADVWSTLRNYRNIRLEVRINSINVITFYERKGYVKIHPVSRWYEDGTDGIVMGKSI